MAKTTAERLPLEPLYQLAARQNPEVSVRVFADMVGTSDRNVTRWKNEGIPWYSADEAAIALGYHPMLVWGDEWLNVKGDFDAICAEVADELEQEMVDAITAEGLED